MPEIPLLLRLLMLAMVIALNGFFASAEVALLSVRTTRLRELAASGTLGAQAALNLRARPQRLLSVVQVGVTLASLVAGWAGEETVSRILASGLGWADPLVGGVAVRVTSFLLAFLILTFLMVVLGEVVPKNVAIQYCDRVAPLTAPLLQAVYRVASPFVWVLERSASLISRVLRVRQEQRGSYTVEELKSVLEASHASGHLSEFEYDIFERVLAVEDLAVREIMVPRNEIVSIPLDAGIDRVLRTFVESRYSRIPVYDRRAENVVGILTRYELLKTFERWQFARLMQREPTPIDLKKLVREVHYVPESKHIRDMPEFFRDKHVKIAMVVDEFGSVAGLVTMEDMLRQLVGDIKDELDVRPLALEETPETMEVEGGITIRELRWEHDIELPEDADFETLAGFLLSRFGYIPGPGDALAYEGRRYTVIEMDKRRIARVLVEKIKPASGGEDEKGAGRASEAEADGSEPEDA